MSRLAVRLAVSMSTAAAVLAPLTAATALAPTAAAAALAPTASVPTAPGATVHQRVTAADLGPQGPWLRLQDDPGNAGRPPGVQEVSPFADPVRFNGSLHLSVAGAAQAQQAQAAHYFNRKVALSTVAAAPLSYDLYVRGWTSTPSAVPYGANLQLPVFCQGAFTTLSFQPNLATDAQGRSGAVADTWRHFDTGGAALWRTSRAVASFAANTDHPLTDYVAACAAAGDGAIGVIANVGRLGDATASLDTYVDNLTVNGTVYDFTVARTAEGRIGLDTDVYGQSGCRLGGVITFTSPADGPLYTSVGTRIVLTRKGGLAARDVTVTANGQPVAFAAGPNGTLTAVVNPPNDVDLGPGGTYRTPFTVAYRDNKKGAITVTAELLAQGYQPLQPTGVIAVADHR